MIVAHSHGGNIAIACLNHVALGSDDLAIVTLATPFVEVFRSRLTDRQRQAFWYLKFMWYYVLLVAVGALLFFAVSFADRAFTLTDDAAAAVLVALVAILGALLFYGFIRLRRSLRLRGRERIARLEETTSHVVLSRFKGRFLVLRAIDDEASLVLAMGSVGTRLANLLFSLYGFNLTTVFVVSAVVLGAGELVSGGPLGRMHLDWVGDLLRVVYFAVFWIIILAPPAVLLLVLVSGAFRSVFGREIFNAPLACDVNSHSVPDISGVTVVTLRGEGAVRSLRHGLYELPGVVRVIAEWNDRRVDR